MIYSGYFFKVGLVSLKGQSPTTYHFLPPVSIIPFYIYQNGNLDLI